MLFQKTDGNRLEIEVANIWVSRLIGNPQPANKDARKLTWPSGMLGGMEHPAGRYSVVTDNYYKPSSPLQLAGLVGPVSILTSASTPPAN